MPRLYVITHVDVMPPYTEAAETLLRNRVATVATAPGVESIDALQQVHRKNHFELMTVYASEEAYDQVVSTPEAREFHNQIDPMLGAPMDDRIHFLLG